MCRYNVPSHQRGMFYISHWLSLDTPHRGLRGDTSNNTSGHRLAGDDRESTSGVGDRAGDDVLGDGGLAEHVVLAGKLPGRAVNGMRDE